MPLVRRRGRSSPIRDALSQLQMAFAREAQGGGEPPAEAPEPPAGAAEPAGAAAEPGRPPTTRPSAPRRASKIWTPPGT